ncbi:MAG: substrate-binding periplasmic protein, partial [Bdellovibrionales bacterium]
YELINELANRLGLTVEWTEEVNFTTMSEALKNNHFDSICFSLYRDSPRASWTEMTAPIFFSGHGVFVREKDDRFSGQDFSVFNSPNITIAGVDGELSSVLARRDYPKAKLITLPQTTSPAELLMMLTTQKADVVFVNVNSATLFAKAHPGLIKNLDATHPIAFFSHGFAFNKGEIELKNMFDIVFEEMQNQGFVKKILEKYQPAPGGYLAVAKPYAPL